jgi:hypothetical protein
MFAAAVTIRFTDARRSAAVVPSTADTFVAPPTGAAHEEAGAREREGVLVA